MAKPRQQRIEYLRGLTFALEMVEVAFTREEAVNQLKTIIETLKEQEQE